MMNELMVFTDLYKFLGALGPMRISMTGKTFSVGFTPMRFAGKVAKFATLNGEKNHQCLILHVDAGNPTSTRGEVVQDAIQMTLGFDIQQMRKFKRKNHEAYIPLEVLTNTKRLEAAKELIENEYFRAIKK